MKRIFCKKSAAALVLLCVAWAALYVGMTAAVADAELSLLHGMLTVSSTATSATGTWDTAPYITEDGSVRGGVVLENTCETKKVGMRLTNASGVAAWVSFDIRYEPSSTNNAVQVGSTIYSSGVSCSVCLESGASVDVVYSPSGKADDPASLTLSDFRIALGVSAADEAIFDADGVRFADLNGAARFAADNGLGAVRLLADGTLPAGSYTIPSGVTLVIPNDESNAEYQKPVVTNIDSNAHVAPSAYRTLTMAAGADITVENGGAICVQSGIDATGDTDLKSWNGTPTGPNGRIVMQDGSSITVGDGGSLYCYGYISGSGSVTAQSGATVWELFQLRGWRTLAALRAAADKGVFPVNQYYVQNIEVPLTICSGAVEKTYSAITLNGDTYMLGVDFIGGSGMLGIGGGDSRVVKDYIEAEDRLKLSTYGDVSLSSMVITMNIMDYSEISSAGRNLPLTNNITLRVESGALSVRQKTDVLPGAVISVAKGAALELGAVMNLYDADQWGGYAGRGLRLIPVGYSAANGSDTVRTEADLADARLDVSGTVRVAGSGMLFTTRSGADIAGADGGVIVFANGQGSAEGVSMQWDGKEYVERAVPTVPARLKNADGGYVSTSGAEAESGYVYASGAWGLGGDAPVFGDVNGDGNADALDAALILRYAVGLIGAEELPGLAQADVDDDGAVGALDAARVLGIANG